MEKCVCDKIPNIDLHDNALDWPIKQRYSYECRSIQAIC